MSTIETIYFDLRQKWHDPFHIPRLCIKYKPLRVEKGINIITLMDCLQT